MPNSADANSYTHFVKCRSSLTSYAKAHSCTNGASQAREPHSILVVFVEHVFQVQIRGHVVVERVPSARVKARISGGVVDRRHRTCRHSGTWAEREIGMRTRSHESASQ